MAPTRSAAITEHGLTYAAGVQPHISVRRPGEGPLPLKPWSGRVRPTSQRRRDAKHQPVKVKELALGLPAWAWEMVTWREGSPGQLTFRFARLRVRAAHCGEKLEESRLEEQLLVEWPEDEEQPTKYWISTVPESISFADLVDAQSCGGASSVTIRTCSRRSASATMKGEAGAGSTTMPRCASLPTAS